MVFFAEKTNHELYDEMPTHVLAECKAMADHSALRHAYLMIMKELASFGRKTVLVEY